MKKARRFHAPRFLAAGEVGKCTVGVRQGAGLEVPYRVSPDREGDDFKARRAKSASR